MKTRIKVLEEIPMTSEDFLRNFNEENNTQYSVYDTNFKLMVEFAKYHVGKALESASEVDYEVFGQCGCKVIDRDGILNAYPPSNIK